jgi:hypothetical protein
MDAKPITLTHRQLVWLVLSAVALGIGIALLSQGLARLGWAQWVSIPAAVGISALATYPLLRWSFPAPPSFGKYVLAQLVVVLLFMGAMRLAG